MMDSLDSEIFDALKNFEALTPCSESTIFRELARLEKLYSHISMYKFNINGILVNIGKDLNSIRILSSAVNRLTKLVEQESDDRFFWQLGNAYQCMGVIKCGYPPKIDELADSSELLEARKWFDRVSGGDDFCPANTDAASILDTYSRNYEAVLRYDRVLDRYPNFGMALGNKAIALKYFFDLSATGNPEVLIAARDLLKAALESPDTIQIGGQQSAEHFQQVLKGLEDFLNAHRIPSSFKCRVALEDMPHHIQFFKEHEMFLNFCFKCSICEAGLKDNVFPKLIERLGERKKEEFLAYGGFSRRVFYCLKMLNHIFEDFATARWIFYQAREQKKVLDELDGLTKYIDALDYTRNKSQFGLFKSAFSKLYGILDKVAYWVFFNYELGKEEVFFEDLHKQQVRNLIIKDNQYQLLALYSLARDFLDGGSYSHLRRIRNLITHRFVDLGEVWNESVIPDGKASEQFLSLDEFQSCIFQMFSIAKAAVFYFLNSVRSDYLLEQRDKDEIVPGIPVRSQDEMWKE